MDWFSNVAQLAALVGPTVLTLAVTDGYETSRARFVRLFGRGDADRESATRARLDGTAAALAAASDDEERERVRAEHAQRWGEDFTRLLLDLDAGDRERMASELREISRELYPAAETAGISMSGVAFHGPTNLQVGHHGHQVNNFGSAG
ncbi:hypothetical protein [Streptomyces sp. NPDC005486]|uniref:hypothetical protein n=1 Tax=Streptomyces sp. NPDC005486 TaxID=3155345 RepID=UPI00339F29BA